MNDWNRRPDGPGPGPGAERRWTAGERLLFRRRFGRWAVLVPIAIIGVPVGLFMLIGLMTDSTGNIDSPFGIVLAIFTVVLIGSVGLLVAALPILVPVAIVAIVIYSWRKQRATAAPPSADFSGAQSVAAAPDQAAARAGAAQPSPAAQPQRFGTLDLAADPALKAELAGLEAVRADLANQITRRLKVWVPLGGIAGLLFGITLALTPGKSSGSPLLMILVLAGMGLIFAYIYAQSGGQRDAYAKAFKDRIMPLWLARYGALSYGPGTLPDLSRLAELGIVPRYVKGTAEDEITGTYREHRLRLNEVVLIGPPRNKEKEPVVYRGLIVELWVRVPYLSTTAVVDNGVEARLATFREKTLQTIGLESGAFAQLYRVYGTDQVAARAVLTPTVMERLMTLSDGHGFYPPHLLAAGDRITLCFPYVETTDLFEPPDLTANNVVQQLAGQHRELDEIFRLVDAVIDTQILRRSA